MGIRWDPREASALRRDLIEVFRQYSIVWMWERSLVERLRSDGVEAKVSSVRSRSGVVRPQSVAEGLHCDAAISTHDVAFVATYTRARCDGSGGDPETHGRHLGQQLAAEVETLSGQHRVHPPVWGSAVGDIYSRAAVSLNVLNAENLGGPNMRTFEVPGSGGVMLARLLGGAE